MTRPLRIDIAGGWYHITSRGQNGERIFLDDRDRAELVDRAGEMTKRYGVEIHAYALMPNHYHLLIRTPKANAIAAQQWLNNGYAMWWNRRHGRTGHVFQGRFKGVLIEGGSWVFELSLYVHYNPVALGHLGWGKQEKKAEGVGWKTPSAEVVKVRLETLRSYRWSSYRGYAGYERVPAWLSTGEVLGRVKGGREGYRKEAEGRLRQGREERAWEKLRWGVVLGSEQFAEGMRRKAGVVRETRGRRVLRQEVEWEGVVKAVEGVKGEPWSRFMGRHGDWGRDLALWVARRRAGLTLAELGARAGGMDYSAVSEAIRYFERRRLQRADVRRAKTAVLQFLNLET